MPIQIGSAGAKKASLTAVAQRMIPRRFSMQCVAWNHECKRAFCHTSRYVQNDVSQTEITPAVAASLKRPAASSVKKMLTSLEE